MEDLNKKHGAREALLKAAHELFIERSYDSVSTRELAERAGVNLGSIQYYFGSKAKLFAEAVKAMMEESSCAEARELLNEKISSPKEAAVQLCRFIEFFLNHLLHPKGPQACRVMFREIMTSHDSEMFEALVNSVIKEFTQPTDEALMALLGKIKPEATKEELEFCTQSIIGQCSFYITHQPFIEKLRGRSPTDPELFPGIVEHVARFSLRGFGCKEAFINDALEGAFAGGQSLIVRSKRP